MTTDTNAGTPVKRYTQTSGAMVETFDTFEGRPTGDWIKYSDYQRELAAANARLERLRELAKAILIDPPVDGAEINVFDAEQALRAAIEGEE